METRLTLRPGQSGTKKLVERLGALWRPAQKLWELKWADAKLLGIADRVAT